MFSLFSVIRYYGIPDETGIQISEEYEDAYDLERAVIIFSIFGFLIGIVNACIEIIFDRFVPKRFPIWFNLFITTFVYLTMVILIATVVIENINHIYNLDLNNDFGWWRQDKTFRVLMLYIFFMGTLYAFIKIVNDKFGKGVLLKMLLGKYKTPKEEKRIFMFLDLKSSTTYAERLGHQRYSQFIQDCFYDLNDIVEQYEAEIYQYVGDEAVLSWPYKKGINRNNCIALFFSFEERLQSKKDYYIRKHGVFPEFKAGVHGGVLIVAEVGIVKKELAYHGDVINTAARIQGECNNYGATLIISEDLLTQLDTKDYQEKHLGNVRLKGKKKEINIYKITS